MNVSESKLIIRQTLAALFYHSGATRYLQTRANPPWRILTYHRVIHPESQNYPMQPGMYVRPETFEMQMKYLALCCTVLPLDTLLTAIAENQPIAPGTVAITFDDGWYDNYSQAFPILHDLNLPATIFLATAYIGTNDYFWTDRVSQTITAIQKSEYRERVIDLIEKIEIPSKQVLTSIVQILTLPESKEQTDHSVTDSLDSLIEELKRLSLKDRKPLIDTLHKLMKEFTQVRSERMFLNWDEVKEMSKANISFGSHSHNHLKLSELTPLQLKDELINSYQAMKSHDLKPSSAFCYPGGYYSSETQASLREKSIRFALSVEKNSDFTASPILLSRTHIHDDITNTQPLFALRLWGPRIFE